MNLKGSKTEQNLYQAFAGESRVRNKYTLYAEKAEKQGYHYIAFIFNQTAHNELAHARRAFDELLKVNRTTEENLIDSAMGEAFESEKLYKEFAKTAREEGFVEVSEFFTELSEAEEYHKERFERILKNLKSGKMFRRDTPTEWHCLNCGYIHEGTEAPNPCPLCKYAQGYYELYCKNFD